MFNKDTIDYMSSAIRYNVSTYLDLYSIFISNYKKNIENFYRYKEEKADIESFDFLLSMIKESSKIDDLIKLNKTYFTRIDHWNLVEFIDDIKSNLETIKNSDKWLGSSKTKGNWRSSSIQTETILQQNQTLEDIAYDQFGADGQNKWVDLSIENGLLEKDYSNEGGNDIQITTETSGVGNFSVKSVVDNLIGERLYGMDICKKITFENDDIKVMSFLDTVKQSVLILSSVEKGDIPEYPTLGIDNFIGENVGMLIYSSLVRQLQAVFSTDDTITDFSVNEMYYEEGDLIIKYSVNTFFNQVFNSQIKI